VGRRGGRNPDNTDHRSDTDGNTQGGQNSAHRPRTQTADPKARNITAS